MVAYALEAAKDMFVDQFGMPHLFAEDHPLPLNSRCYGSLRHLMWEREGKTVPADAMNTAAGTLTALAEG
jgi:hypothetical protein